MYTSTCVGCFFLLEENKGEEDKADRRRGRETENTRKWTGLEFAKSQRAVENREKWKTLIAKSSVVPQKLAVKG